ncbi:MAG: SAM-dependent methyltransferase [Actinomycetes bacterium]
MRHSDVALLSSADGRHLLEQLPPYDERRVLALDETLRRQGHSPELVTAALTQVRLRTAVGRRWGASGAHLIPHILMTPDGAEQATRPSVAALRAQRFRSLGPEATVADLGCGIGLDALALVAAGIHVAAYERDRLTAAVAVANATAMGCASQLTVTCADVTELTSTELARSSAAFADPARRRDGRRLLQPESWSPPLSWVLDLPFSDLGVKVAPGLDRARVPGDTEFAVVSDGGDVVEAALYRGATRARGVRRSATVLPSGAEVTDNALPTGPPTIAPTGAYLHEPDGAVIRAGLVAAVAQQVEGWLIDPQIAYVSTDEPADSPFLKSYQVFEVMPFSLKRLRAHLRDQGVGHVVVKKRGSAVNVDELRRSLRLDRGASGQRTILLTRVGSDPLAIIGRPVPESRAS